MTDKPKTFEKGSLVVCGAAPNGPRGTVLRLAKDGSWADVEWTGKILIDGPFERWSKRMKVAALAKVPFMPLESK